MASVAPLRIKLLGGFEAGRVQGLAVEIAARKTRALLAYLALTMGRPQGRDRLANLLWSDRSDKQARDSLRQALTELRDAFADLNPPPLATHHDSVSIDRAAIDVDALEFERLAQSNGADDLRRAAGLYGGDLLDGIGVKDPAFEEWLGGERRHYRELAISVLKKLLAHEQGAAALAVAQQLLVLDPLQEEGHRALMRAHASAGDIAMALRQYETCRDILKRDLDIAPSSQTEALHRQIKDQSTAGPVHDPFPGPTPNAPRPPPVSTSKPSVAVLPFKNLSGDPEQQYFSDGITEDIITELSRYHYLFVIAHSSSLLFRDKTADTKQIGRDLGIEYVVEGSIRRMGTRLRVTAQLIETATGNSLWAERYDRDMQEIFDVQDEVVRAIVAVLPGRIEEAGARSAKLKRPESLAAYDYLLRGYELTLAYDASKTQAAREMFEKALALDGTISSAITWLALLRLRDWWTDRSQQGLNAAFELAKKAVATDEYDGRGHGVLGMVYLDQRRFVEATFHVDRFLSLNPNDPTASVIKGELLAYLGRADEGIEWIEKAFRLNPLSPQAYNAFYAMILFAARRYEESIAALNRILSPPDAWIFLYLVAGNGYLDRTEEACALIDKCKAQIPGISLLEFALKEPFKHSADLDHLLDGLRQAGLSG